MEITTNRLDFVTIEGLLAYAEEFAGHSAAVDVQLPPATGRTEPRRPWTPCAALSRTRSGVSPELRRIVQPGVR
jgi:hypothetical protein